MLLCKSNVVIILCSCSEVDVGRESEGEGYLQWRLEEGMFRL